jgi:hypothetical protein
MQMTPEPPILDTRQPTAEEERLVELFAEIEGKQLDFLDQAAKRIIELVTALLGILFAVIAFGSDFPPPYLAGNLPAKLLSGASLVCYLGALLVALWAVQPRDYKHYRHNLTEMREELQRMIDDKARPLRVAGILFGAGSILLAVLIATVIWSA